MLCSACSSSFYTSSFAFSLTWDVLAVSVQYLQSNPSPLYVLSSSQPLKGFVGLSVLPGERVIGQGKVGRGEGRGPEITWERDDQFQKKYPHFFTNTTPKGNSI
ncbi:hypothetical protein Tco_1025278 [Tanacetum coccineum]